MSIADDRKHQHTKWECDSITEYITECMTAVFGDRFDPNTLLVEVDDDGCALASWEGVYIDRDHFGKWGFGRLLHIPGNREIPDETDCEECGVCSTFDLALTQAAGLYAEHLISQHLDARLDPLLKDKRSPRDD